MHLRTRAVKTASPVTRANFRRRRIFGALLFAFATPLLLTATAARADVSLDQGPKNLSDVATVTVVLNVQDPGALAQFVEDVTNPSSGSYHKFLSPAEFAARFAPAATDVGNVTSALNAAGIGVTDVSSNRLVVHAQGTVAALNQYFSTSVHNYTNGAQSFYAPSTVPTVPTAIRGKVAAVVGMSSEAVYQSRHVQTLEPMLAQVPASSPAVAGNAPGSYTTFDVANFYQMQPLYNQGFAGQGRTIGIATLATFNPTDAYAYWTGIGLTVKPNRITQVHVDGGGGSNGADETTLDVEQSGGLAPMADIIVYDAPNTDQGFLDVFANAVAANLVDTLSVSWGQAEFTQTAGLGAAMDLVFAQAAAQGISMFAATGDSGSYDFNDPSCKNVLSVDAPSSSPYITAAGGLTLPGLQTHKFAKPVVNVPALRPWAWDYLKKYFNQNYRSQGGYLGLAFPVGGGGGVSVTEAVPTYQQKVPGVKTSAAQQSVTCLKGNQYVDELDLPAGYAGRNVPDLSLNADPYTGYSVYFEGAWESGWGGTSFVAPQLNGMMAVVGQSIGSRLGLINPALYKIATGAGAYTALTGPFVDITTQDNLGYKATKGYDPASGIGAINAANFAAALAAAH